MCDTALEVINAYLSDWHLVKSTVERLTRERAEAEAIILDLALIHDGRAARNLNELVIAAREWMRSHERPENP
jgi:hypothetical protein